MSQVGCIIYFRIVEKGTLQLLINCIGDDWRAVAEQRNVVEDTSEFYHIVLVKNGNEFNVFVDG